MSDAPVVSVVTIFLNAGRFIEETIASVFAQEFPSWELLLVDDGSTDGGSELARLCASANPDRVRYLQHPGGENRGMSASRNLGIVQACGELIALLDADDLWLPQKLDRQVALFRQFPDAGMMYDATKYWYTWPGGPGVSPERQERLRRLGFPAGTLVQPPDLVPLFLKGVAETPGTCSALFRRDACLQVGGFVETFRGMYEDQAFFFKMALEFPTYLDEGFTALYRQHDDSACSVAARNGLYRLAAGSNACEEAFLGWLADHVTERLHDRNDGANRLPNALKTRLRRRAGHKGASSFWTRLLWRLDPEGRAAAMRSWLSIRRS